MEFTEYKKEKLEEIYEYSDKLYDNYKDLTDSTNKGIITLSYTAIFAIFMFLYKVKVDEYILTLVRISIALLFFTLTILLVLYVVYALDASSKEKKYKRLHNELFNEENEKLFKKRITDSHNEMVNSNFYDTMFSLNMFSYFLFLLAYGIIAYIIIFKV